VFERFSKPIISKGKVIGSIWSFRDITEKKRNEARQKDVNKILYGLKSINQIQSEINDRGKLIRAVCNVVVDTMGFSSAMINLFENNKFVAGAQKGFDKCYQEFENKLKNNHFFYCYTQNNGKDLLIIDHPEKTCQECPLTDCYDENIIYSIPIVYQNITYGIFNVNINKRYKEDKDFQDMGTTLTLSLLINNKLFYGHVGDSRIYIFNDELKQITKDHSLVNDLIDNNSIKPAEAFDHPQKNIITQALGIDKDLKIQTNELDITKKDIIMLCTDGLSDMIRFENIEEVLKKDKSLKEIIEELGSKALKNGGTDNITIIMGKL